MPYSAAISLFWIEKSASIYTNLSTPPQTISIFAIVCYNILMLIRPEEDELVVGIADAARMIGVHPFTLKRWEKAGYITSIRVGKRRDRRYFLSEINRIRGEA